MKIKLIKIFLITLGIFTTIYAKSVISVAVPEYSVDIKKSFNLIIKDFEKENPDIEVILDVAPWSKWQYKIQKDFFSGKNADIIYTTRAWLPTYIKARKIEPLDKYLTKENIQEFPKALIDATTINGKIYALPSIASARNLYVNLDILEFIGGKSPETWSELRKLAKKISTETNVFGFGIQGKEVEMEKYFYYILWNFGGSILDKNVNGTKSMLNSKEALKAAQFYNDLIKDGYTQKNVTAYNREDLHELFKRGKLGMLITHGGLGKELVEDGTKINFLQTDVPGISKNKIGKTLGVIDVVHLSSNSKNKQNAIKFLLFSMKPKYQADWVAKSNLLPVTKSASKHKIFNKNHIKAMIKAMPNTKYAFVHDKSIRIIDVIKNMLTVIYIQKKTPEQALKIAHKKINRIARRR